jgi:hypothetical protein
MRLGQAAAALWVNEKTLDNAIRILGLPRPLDEDTVRALGLAFRAKYRYGIPLKRGFPLVREALIRPQSHESAVAREVLAYLPDVDNGIDRQKQDYKSLPPGPGWRDPYHPAVPAKWRRHPAIRRAIWWGLDLSLNTAALHKHPGEHLLELSANVEGIQQLRKGAKS